MEKILKKHPFVLKTLFLRGIPPHPCPAYDASLVERYFDYLFLRFFWNFRISSIEEKPFKVKIAEIPRILRLVGEFQKILRYFIDVDPPRFCWD